MEQLLEFIGNHPFLFGALLIILGLLVSTEVWRWRNSQPRLEPMEAIRLINSEDARVIDVRPAADFERGHIVNARNVPEDRLDSQMKDLVRRRKKPVLVCCANGLASPKIAGRLIEAGLERVFVLKGGLQGWQQAGLPTTRN